MQVIKGEPIFSAENREENESLIRDVLTLLDHRKWTIALITLVVSLIAVVPMLMGVGVFRSTVVITIVPNQSSNTGMDGGAARSSSSDSFIVDTEIEKLNSAGLAAALVDELDLINSPVWNPVLQPKPDIVSALRGLIGMPARPQEAPDVDLTTEAVRTAVINNLDDALIARRRDKTFAVEITVVSIDAAEAARIANTAISIYASNQLDERINTAVNQNEWLNERTEELRAELSERENALETFRSESGLLSAGGVPIGEHQIEAIQAGLIAARADLAAAKARYQQLLTTPEDAVDTLPEVLGSDVVRDLRLRDAEAISRLASVRERYEDKHPDVQNALANLTDIQKQLRNEIDRIALGLRSQYHREIERVSTLEASMAEAQAGLVRNNEALAKMRKLEREAETAREVYEEVLRRNLELAGRERAVSADVNIVSEARPALHPSSMSTAVKVLTALSIGLSCGLVVALVLAQLDDGLKTTTEVENAAGIRVVANVPELTSSQMRLLPPDSRNPTAYILERPVSAFAESIKLLLLAMRKSRELPKGTGRCIAITSSVPGEGKSTIALSLARLAAMYDQRVLLIDGDVRRAALNEYLDIAPAFGLLDVLSGNKEWTDVVGLDEGSGLHVLPSAPAPLSTKSDVDPKTMSALIEAAKKSYDIVIVDCPPVLLTVDARTLCSLADSVAFIASRKSTGAKMLRNAIAQLGKNDVAVDGVVYNQVNSTQVSDSAPLMLNKSYGGYYWG